MSVKPRDINERRYLELYRTSSGPKLVDDQAERRPLLARPFQGLSLVRGQMQGIQMGCSDSYPAVHSQLGGWGMRLTERWSEILPAP